LGIHNLLSACFEKFQKDLSIVKYLINFLTHFIQVNEVEMLLKDFIENLAKTYQIYDISELFSLVRTERKTHAKELLKKSFSDLIQHQSLKKNLFEFYSYLDSELKQKLMEDVDDADGATGFNQNHLASLNDEFSKVKKVIECVKYAEILFDF